jgi:phage gp29-like protein
MKTAQLLDARGQPVTKAVLKTEISRATIGGVRSPISGYPADGLNPQRLAGILREADAGDAIRYLELAETIEERDAHYLGVLGTRRRAVSQMPFTVEAGDDTPEAEAHAQMVRDWLNRDELTEEVFDILDCIGKGYSMTEILWDTSEGQWMPLRLEYRDPRWFRFDRNDLKTPLMLTDTGQEVALPAFKFVFAQVKAKSGITLRSGLARVAAWGWMFKAYTQRDWAIFTQTYGQPLRLGKFGPEASEKDKDTLFTAVSNIAGDCAAIIPQSMEIEFIETSNVGASSDLYENRANWLDMQISKAVLGQTATTDAVTGGLGSGKEHREVQKSIQTADARALAAILNRDLIRPWMQLNFGPLKVYPRLKIEEPEKEDLVALSTAIGGLVDRGLEVDQGELRDKFGLSDPKPGAKLLRPSGGGAPVTGPQPPDREIKRQTDEIKRVEAPAGIVAPQNAERPSGGPPTQISETDLLTDRLAEEAAPAMGAMLAKIEAMLEAAGSLEEFREMVLTAYPDLDVTELAGVMAEAMMAGHAGGRAALVQDSEGAGG